MRSRVRNPRNTMDGIYDRGVQGGAEGRSLSGHLPIGEIGGWMEREKTAQGEEYTDVYTTP